MHSDKTMKLYIKNMVCARCVMVVSDILRQCGVADVRVSLGQADIPAAISDEQRDEIARKLSSVGFELIDNQRSLLVEQIKANVRNYVSSEDDLRPNLSDFLVSHIGREYSTLSSVFSESEGRTIEQYHILVRIERVKELIAYGDKSLSEIAYIVRYSSVAHLSNQFKKVTGMTPSAFKALSNKRRQAIDKV